LKNGRPKTQIMLQITKTDPEMGSASSDPTQQPFS